MNFINFHCLQGTVRGVEGQGMPIYRNPFEKGILYIKFDVKFPENNVFSEDTIKKLEALLPAKPKVDIPVGEHVEEVSMVELSQTKGSSNARAGAAQGGAGAGFFRSDASDEEEGGPQRVECNTH
jgi:DnaJ family protein A protein 2